MGLIEKLLGFVFGGGKNAVVEVAEVFRENSEAAAVRAADIQIGALEQFSSEFKNPNKGPFDKFMDGVNRIPRPALALGTLGLFVSAMTSPEWFMERMAGLSTVPEPLWWLLGAIVSFYFGARHQAKGQDFQRQIIQVISDQKGKVQKSAAVVTDTIKTASQSDNLALDDWHRWRGNVTR